MFPLLDLSIPIWPQDDANAHNFFLAQRQQLSPSNVTIQHPSNVAKQKSLAQRVELLALRLCQSPFGLQPKFSADSEIPQRTDSNPMQSALRPTVLKSAANCESQPSVFPTVYHEAQHIAMKTPNQPKNFWESNQPNIQLISCFCTWAMVSATHQFDHYNLKLVKNLGFWNLTHF